ncbi:hypothetical protein L0F63_007368, partial [Massospora cicadina]
MSISEISNLHAPSIVDALFEIDRQDTQPGKKGNKKEGRQVMSLRIPSNVVAKEVKKLRPCDLASCLYCREWATLALKKGFGTHLKAEVAETANQLDNSNLINDGKDFFIELLELIEQKLIETSQPQRATQFSFLQPKTDLLDYVARATQRVAKCISTDNLISFFEAMDFNLDTLTPPQHRRDPDSPLRLLDAVDTSEKGSLTLPRESFETLKAITPALQASLTIPICNHQKEHILPDQLKLSVTSLSVQLTKIAGKCVKEWEVVAKESWGLFLAFIDSVIKYDQARIEAVSNPAHTRCFQFHAAAGAKPRAAFADYWAHALETFRKGQPGKKKPNLKDPLATLDEMFLDFFNELAFSMKHFSFLLDCDAKLVSGSVAELQGVLNYWLSLAKARTRRHANLAAFQSLLDAKDNADCVRRLRGVFKANFNLPELPHENALLIALEQWEANHLNAEEAIQQAAARIEERVARLQAERAKREQSLADQCTHIIAEWKNAALTSVALKLEKASHKDYRKQIKRLELAYASFRGGPPVADLFVCCLEPLMQEAQLLHLVNFVDLFFGRYRAIIRQHANARDKTTRDFDDGLSHGRRMLGGIAGKLFLREGLRLLEDAKAIEKQNELLQLWDTEALGPGREPGKPGAPADAHEGKAKKKNRRKKKKNGDDIGADNPPLEAGKPSAPLPSLFANHAPHPVVEADPPIPAAAPVTPTPEKAEVRPLGSKLEKREPASGLDQGPTPQVGPPKANAKSPDVPRVELEIKPSDASGGAGLPTPHLNAVAEKLTPVQLSGQEANASSQPRPGVYVQTTQGEKDLTTVSKEKLLMFIQTLLLDKSSLVEAFTAMKAQLDNVSELYSSVLTMIQTQDDALAAQALEIQEYQRRLLLRDVELVRLVHQQNALRRAMLDHPEVRANLNRLLADPAHPLHAPLPPTSSYRTRPRR